MEVFEWIERHLTLTPCTTNKMFYDDMESQSERCLPIIYQPFDVANRAHWRDRGAMFDYLHSCGDGKLMDFGPGDGWPSLIVAPYVGEVVGVEGSRRRRDVCEDNARKLGIGNASFIHVEPGEPLPFDDKTFDGVMAASSLEQTSDAKGSLREIFRVLKKGGRFRIHYEALSGYRQGREREVWLCELEEDRSILFLYDRRIDWEQVRHFGVVFDKPHAEVAKVFGIKGMQFTFGQVTVPVLEELRQDIVEVRTCDLIHPSGATWVKWMEEVGFSKVTPTHSGMGFAGKLFDNLPEGQRPADMEELDTMLRPLVKIVVEMAAPADMDPMITAIV
jgi:ubiquinone/menaquinone biosynthesis C-methylase UbiE